MTEIDTQETQVEVKETAPEAVTETPSPNGATPAEVAAAEETPPEPTVSPLDAIKEHIGKADLYEVEELPEVKKHLERRDRTAREEIQREEQAKFQQATAKWDATQAADKLAGYVGGLLEKIENADLPGAERLTARLETFASENLRNVIEYAKAEGRDTAATNERTELYRTLTQGLDRRSKDDFQDGLRPGMSWEDAIELRDKLKFGPKEEKYKSDIQAKQDVIDRMKAEGRTGAGPNLAQSASGGAGINSMDDADRAYATGNMTHDAYKAARERFGLR